MQIFIRRGCWFDAYGALINLDKLKNIIVTNDTEFWNAIKLMQVNKCNGSIIISYTTQLFNNMQGVMQCTITDDINMTRGIFSVNYEDRTYSLLINEVLRNVTITELAKKRDLTNYTRKERYVIEPNETRNFTIEFGSWGDNIVIIYVNDPWRCTIHSCALDGYIQDLINPAPILELSKSPENNIVTVHNGNSYAVAICFEFK